MRKRELYGKDAFTAQFSPESLAGNQSRDCMWPSYAGLATFLACSNSMPINGVRISEG